MNFRDDRKIHYNDGDIKRIGTVYRHNFPVEDEILNKLEFKVGDKIKDKENGDTFEIASISYNLFRGRDEYYMRYEFTNYQFILTRQGIFYDKVNN